MIYSACDLGIEIDFGNDEPGDVLQRWDGEDYRDFMLGWKPVTSPFDYNILPPGRYLLRPKQSPSHF